MTPSIPGDISLLIFDADDTLRHTLVPNQPCPRAPSEWELLPNVRQVLSTMDWTRLRLGIASNQDQVGYGLISSDTAARLLSDLVSAATGGMVSDAVIRFCPHRLEVPCTCRKPEPGMLLDIMCAARSAASATLFVGNAETDREAARRAGCRFCWADDFFFRRDPNWPVSD